MHSYLEENIPWHTLDPEQAVESSGSSRSGLSADEAQKRLGLYGPNEIGRQKKDSPLKVLWRQINNPLIWVLIASCALAVLLGKVTDGFTVLAVVVINTIIGFIQEFKAGQAIEALIGMVPQNTTVVRDGRTLVVPVRDVVPGDIVMLASGDRVPADMRLLAQKNLQVEEAALTGESVPAQKIIHAVEPDAVLGDRRCMLYGGTLVVSGTSTAVVTGTGQRTELGRISSMLSEAADLETPLTVKIAAVGKYLTIFIIVVTLLILAIGTWRAMAQGVAFGPALKETVIFAIALAVGAIPEGLPAVVTIALAIGVQRMARRNAIIRKLPAVETLGSTTVICTDKTGTLTRNEMTVTEMWTPGQVLHVEGTGYDPAGCFLISEQKVNDLPPASRLLLENAVLCNDADLRRADSQWCITGDPTEAALVVAAAKAGINAHALRGSRARIDAIPFESEHQFMATLNEGPERRVIMKGAPEVVLNRCAFLEGGAPFDRERVLAEVERMGSRGMRVLAVAEKIWTGEGDELLAEDVREGFTLSGLMGMIDPPRPEAIDAVAACHRAGIIVKMITGDHRVTARSIGMEIGLSKDGASVTGSELSAMDDGVFSSTARETNIFARVAPEHKIRLVSSLQEDGEIVAMTGDGVNDAPALKQSNIGVAMGITGTSVAKESADIVLADDNFASIRAAVEEGRRVYDNLVKSLAFLMPTNMGLALILIYAVMFFPFNPATKDLLLPMKPTQLLWINLVAAVALALPLAFEVKEPDVMRRPPRRPGEPLFSRFVVFRTVLVSVAMSALSVFIFHREYHAALDSGMDAAAALPLAQTVSVTFVIMFQIFYMLNCRSLKDSVWKIGLFSNWTVFLGIGTVLALQAVFIYAPFMQAIFSTVPLDARQLGIASLSGMIILPVIGLEKWIRSRFGRSSRAA